MFGSISSAMEMGDTVVRPADTFSWNMVLLLIFTMLFVFRVRYLLYQINTLRSEQMASELRLQNEISRLSLKVKRLRTTPRPQAYSLADFAVEAVGGQVIHILSSRTYQREDESIDRAFLQMFISQKGELFISLAQRIHVSHVTLGHITKQQSPTGEIWSAPNTFTIYGLESLNVPETRLGSFYYYIINGDSLQTFPILEHTEKTFRFVRLEIHNDFGNAEYTFLYNFRVHGRVPGVI